MLSKPSAIEWRTSLTVTSSSRATKHLPRAAPLTAGGAGPVAPPCGAPPAPSRPPRRPPRTSSPARRRQPRRSARRLGLRPFARQIAGAVGVGRQVLEREVAPLRVIGGAPAGLER